MACVHETVALPLALIGEWPTSGNRRDAFASVGPFCAECYRPSCDSIGGEGVEVALGMAFAPDMVNDVSTRGRFSRPLQRPLSGVAAAAAALTGVLMSQPSGWRVGIGFGSGWLVSGGGHSPRPSTSRVVALVGQLLQIKPLGHELVVLHLKLLR